ncbi:MAG: 3-dehydroquinate synthase [Candidatus Brocadiales bacterium]|nr:3-dehydroquinate synthase [Candidatus Brocadiales bacterium]MBL7005940.1 3-dehydroquinate synthase [Spirochaetia bacterium]
MKINCKIGQKSTQISFYKDREKLLEIGGNGLFIFDEFTVNFLQELPRNYLVIGRGEAYKRLEIVEEILTKAVESGLGRDAQFIAVGGGVVCDITAFAASIYMRGVSLILIPTTLLSMVDASLGGKTGVDFRSYKNLVGSFYPAEEVRIYTFFIDTLSTHEYLNGLAEIIKHSLLTGGKFFSKITDRKEEILNRNLDVVEELVYESLLIKKEYVEEDPYEKNGLRAKLNFGHTFGHAYEAITGLENVSHGEAVAWGISRALEAGRLLEITDTHYAETVSKLLHFFNYSIDTKIVDITKFLEALKHDKKNINGLTKFVIQRNLADTYITELPEDIIIKSVM